MARFFAVCAILAASVMFFGCSQKTATVAEVAPHYVFEEDGALVENDPVTGHKVVRKAKSAIGTPYVFGGSEPGGFDCSGLVKWAYNSVGVKLPRTAREQSVVGKKVEKVKDMRAGDIVAFRHPRRGYHTGIYLGNGKFVHSPRKRSSVRINSLHEPYFSSTLLGARRVKLDGSENLIAQAEERLSQYVTRKATSIASSSQLAKAKKSDNSLSRNSKKALSNKSSHKITAKAKSVNLRKAAAHSVSKKSAQHKNTKIVAQKEKRQVTSKKVTRAVSMAGNKKQTRVRGRNS